MFHQEESDFKNLPDTFILNENILLDLYQYTKKILPQATQPIWMSDFYKKAPNYKEAKNANLQLIKALKIFNSGLTEKAISIHHFELRSLEKLNKAWDAFLSTLNPAYFKYAQRAYHELRPLITLYHSYLEEQLKQLRVAASHAQMEYTLIHEKIFKLENIIRTKDDNNQADSMSSQLQLDEALDQTTEEKKALNQIAAIVKYNKELRAELKNTLASSTTHSVFTTISQLSDIKKQPPIQSSTVLQPTVVVNQRILPDKPAMELNYPVITICLLDLKTLQSLNENSKKLLTALQGTSFWTKEIEESRNQLIALIKNFNECFRITHLSENILIEKANICLQDLMIGIQHSPRLHDFEEEDKICRPLQKFIALYGKKLRETAKEIYTQYYEMNYFLIGLKEKLISLQPFLHSSHEVKHHSNQEIKKIEHSLVHKSDLYKKALIEIAATILIDKTDYPATIIPVLLLILKQCYETLANPKFDMKKIVEKDVKISEEKSVLPILISSPIGEDKMIDQTNLSWRSLTFMHSYIKILLDQYTAFNPNRSWWLWGEELGQYRSFCLRMKNHLKACNDEFVSSTTIPVEVNNMLVSLTKEIQNSLLNGIHDTLSWDFYKIYTYEKDLHTQNQQEYPLLNWERLKNLNKSSQALLQELQTWEDTYCGYLTYKPLLIGAIHFFKSQFLSESIREKQDTDEIMLMANKALSCIMLLIARHADLPFDSNNFKLLHFIIQYNWHVKETIEESQVSIHRKKYHEQLLAKTIDELKNNQSLEHDSKFYCIQKMVQSELDQEPVCFDVLRQIPRYLPHHIDLPIQNISSLLHVCDQIDLTIQPSKDHKENKKSCTGSTAESDWLSPSIKIKATPLFTLSLLALFREKTAERCLKDLTGSSVSKNEQINKMINLLKKLIQYSRDNNLEQADRSLQALVQEMIYSDYRFHFKEEISWPIYYFLIGYNNLLTQRLQHLYEVEHELTQICDESTKRIDALKQHNKMQYAERSYSSKALIQQILEKEQLKDKPFKKTVNAIAHKIFSIQTMNAQEFSICVPILRAIYSIFTPQKKDAPSPAQKEKNSFYHLSRDKA